MAASESKRARRREWRANHREHWSNEREHDHVQREALRWGVPPYSWGSREQYDQRMNVARGDAFRGAVDVLSMRASLPKLTGENATSAFLATAAGDRAIELARRYGVFRSEDFETDATLTFELVKGGV